MEEGADRGGERPLLVSGVEMSMKMLWGAQSPSPYGVTSKRRRRKGVGVMGCIRPRGGRGRRGAVHRL